MVHEKIPLEGKTADGYVVPLAGVNLVFATTAKGMVACGAIDVAALNRFGYPAARVRPAAGPSIATISDLLNGIIREANAAAQNLGVEVGMTGRDALRKL